MTQFHCEGRTMKNADVVILTNAAEIAIGAMRNR